MKLSPIEYIYKPEKPKLIKKIVKVEKKQGLKNKGEWLA